jgi:hypothetical protein
MEISMKSPQKTGNRAGGVAQAVEHLPSKREALSSNSSPDTKKLQKTPKTRSTYDPAIPPLGIYPKESKSAYN